MDILFMIPTLGAGGAERALVQMVNEYSVSYPTDRLTVFTLFNTGIYRKALSDNVGYQFAFKRMFSGNIHLFKLFSPQLLYKQMIKKEYDIVVSYLEGPTTRIVSGNTSETKLINWVHTSPTNTDVLLRSYRSKNEFIRCMRNYSSTVFVSESAGEEFMRVFPELVDLNHTVIYNPINSAEIRQKAKVNASYFFPSDTFNIVSVGRLNKIKGFERLIQACVKIKSSYKISLFIIGGGEEEEALQKLIRDKQAGDYIHLLGFRENPYPLIAQASLFVCSSFREGYSTSVIEALVLGIPVVTTLCSGMTEILGAGDQYGLIVDNSENGITDGIYKMLKDKTMYWYYKEKAKERGNAFCLGECVSSVERYFLKILQ